MSELPLNNEKMMSRRKALEPSEASYCLQSFFFFDHHSSSLNKKYDKCPKISYKVSDKNWHMQTVQIQIRLLLQKK